MNEIHRVLRPGREALIADLRKDTSFDEIDRYVKQSGRNPIDAWMTRWTFRHMLLKRAYAQDEFLNMARQSKFGSCQIEISGIGLKVRFMKPSRITETVVATESSDSHISNCGKPC